MDTSKGNGRKAAIFISVVGWISLLALCWLPMFIEGIYGPDYIAALIVSFLYGFFGAVSGAERRQNDGQRNRR